MLDFMNDADTIQSALAEYYRTTILAEETDPLKDDTELFKQFMDNESFRRWLTETVFELTYHPEPAA